MSDTSENLRQRVKNMLPEPFEWCSIPTGEVSIAYGEWKDYTYIVSETRTYQLDAFWIAKYPLTVAQFEPFVAIDGYTDKSYWTDEGWDWIQKTGFRSPRYWNSEKWHIADHPVVHITPCEAHAYLRWLSQQVKLEINLPTEQQWQRAAQGNDGRNYPWGNEHQLELANTYESKIAKTTPVIKYPDNISPFGVMDMSGNVWEMTSSPWHADIPIASSHYEAVVRGGSFNSFNELSKCTARRLGNGWDYSFGFRIAVNG